MRIGNVALVFAVGFAACSQSKKPEPAATCNDEATCADACNSGHKRSCEKLADVIAVGKTRCNVKSIPYYIQACDGGVASACAKTANCLEQGAGISMDQVRALALYERACHDGSPEACVDLALAQLNGRLGLSRDSGKARETIRRANELWERDCTAEKNALSCLNAAIGYEAGDRGQKDPKQAIFLWDLGCKVSGEDGAACCEGAKNLRAGKSNVSEWHPTW